MSDLPVRRLKNFDNLRVGSIISLDGNGGQTVIYDASQNIDNRATTSDEQYLTVRRIAAEAGLFDV